MTCPELRILCFANCFPVLVLRSLSSIWFRLVGSSGAYSRSRAASASVCFRRSRSVAIRSPAGPTRTAYSIRPGTPRSGSAAPRTSHRRRRRRIFHLARHCGAATTGGRVALSSQCRSALGLCCPTAVTSATTSHDIPEDFRTLRPSRSDVYLGTPAVAVVGLSSYRSSESVLLLCSSHRAWLHFLQPRWHWHLPPFKRCSEPWSKHAGDSKAACKAALRTSCGLYLTTAAAPVSSCPVSRFLWARAPWCLTRGA